MLSSTRPRSQQQGRLPMSFDGRSPLRGDTSSEVLKLRLRDEIHKLEQQLARLQHGDNPRRFALMETYQTMISTRQELLVQVETRF